MRTIKFRGRTDDNRWVYGSSLTLDADDYAAITVCKKSDKNVTVKIDPGTLGQYTGLKDANGNEIYEGDIIADLDNLGIRHLIFYKEIQGRFMAALNGDIENDFFGVCGLDDKKWIACKVIIGNIYDNPELLNINI